MEDNIKEIDFFDDDYKPTVFDRIKWWLQDARFYPRDIKSGIKNLIAWFPIIWRDRDWDDHYIFEVLKFKIKKQAKYIADRNFHSNAKRDAEIMNLVVKLIELEQDETYGLEYLNYEKSKYYFVENDKDFYGEKTYELKSDEISENFDEYIKKYPRQYEKAVSGELKRFTRYDDETKNKQIYAMEIAHENEERCHRLLFKILAYNIRKWWD
jgi:hypothetical protein